MYLLNLKLRCMRGVSENVCHSIGNHSSSCVFFCGLCVSWCRDASESNNEFVYIDVIYRHRVAYAMCTYVARFAISIGVCALFRSITTSNFSSARCERFHSADWIRKFHLQFQKRMRKIYLFIYIAASPIYNHLLSFATKFGLFRSGAAPEFAQCTFLTPCDGVCIPKFPQSTVSNRYRS